MTAVTVPLYVVLLTLTVIMYAYGVRRLLGLRLSPLRTLIGGAVALACGSPIISVVGGSSLKHRASVLPGLWFVMLGAAISLLPDPDPPWNASVPAGLPACGAAHP